jgi:sulfate adenylyltransferase
MNTPQILQINRDQYLELEKIGIGAFLPLKGFMTQVELLSVANFSRLPSGDVFPIPVLLDIADVDYQRLKSASSIALEFGGVIVGYLFPSDFYRCEDRVDIAKKVYGTSDNKHPGVNHFYSLNPIFVGGNIEFLGGVKTDISMYEISPQESIEYFRSMGWKKITGFQTRNVPHRAHEYLLRIALEYSDGLFIQPLLGKKRISDYTPEAIVRGYEVLINNYLPRERILFGSLSTLMRYAGPREAVFHALIRRNYGCTHFIVGRDHAGVGDWYQLYEAHEYTKQFDGELGIEIMRLKGPFYCSICDCIATENTCNHQAHERHEISGTQMRAILSSGKTPLKHLMRKEVVSALNGVNCFIT